MKPYAQVQTEDRRLVLLRALAAASQYRANALLLRRYCDAVGHTVSADAVATDLAWLAEQGMVGTEEPQGVLVATLTQRGLDVAEGRAKVPGVAVPMPGV